MDTPTVSAVSEAISSRKFLFPGTYVWKWSLPWMLPVYWSPPQAVWLEWWPCHSNNVFGVLFQDVMLVDQVHNEGSQTTQERNPLGDQLSAIILGPGWVPVETFMSRTYIHRLWLALGSHFYVVQLWTLMALLSLQILLTLVCVLFVLYNSVNSADKKPFSSTCMTTASYYMFLMHKITFIALQGQKSCDRH